MAIKKQSVAMTKYKIRKNFLIAAILATGLISALIGVVAYFGLNMGTFVISLDQSAYYAGISLCETEDFTASYPRLLVKPMTNAYPVAYDDINFDDVINSDGGNYTDPRGYTYLGYTFFLKNDGTTTVDLSFDILITQVTRNVDSATRIMLVEDENKKIVYLKNDGTEKHPFDQTPDELCEYFKDDKAICNHKILNFKPNDIKKFSLIIWLEGWDPECTDSVKGGQIKMEMTFKITNAKVDD